MACGIRQRPCQEMVLSFRHFHLPNLGTAAGYVAYLTYRHPESGDTV